MFKKTLALVLCALMAMGTLAACGEDAAAPYVPVIDQPGSQSGTQSADAEVTVAPSEDILESEPTEPVEETGMGNPDTVVGAGMEYINTLRVDVSDYSANGVVYAGDNEKYGIMTLDGANDTGAIYVNAAAEGDNFMVRTQELGAAEELDKINSVGLVDKTGKELIPAKYALVEDISDRFYRVVEATELTDSDEYLLYMRKSAFTVQAGEDDPRYLGVWSVYDIQTGAEVPGVTGTKAGNISVYGDILSFYVENTRCYFNAAGTELPAGASYYSNGTYYVSADKTVYDSQGNAVLVMEDNGYSISNWDERYYRVHKYENGVTTYAYMDEAGNICSGEFPKSPYLEEGGIVSSDDKLYDLQGNCIFEKDPYTVYYYDGLWLIRDADKNIYMMDSNYNVEFICQMTEDTEYSLSGTDFAVTKREDGKYYYYSAATKQFAEGRAVAKGMVERDNANDNTDLLSTMTDETLLTNYRYYNAEESDEGVYIFARAEGGAYDVFFFAA